MIFHSKPCIGCGLKLPLDQFYRHPRMADGRLNKCKLCVRSDVNRRHRRLIEDPIWREQQRKRHRNKYHRLASTWKRKRDAHKRKAQTAVGNAVRDKRLMKPSTCLRCGTTSERIEAHHPDYNKPLDVVWLCTLCHGKEHRRAEP